MARKGAQITKEFAKEIAKKLNAQIDSSSAAHDLASVFHEATLVAQFGIRRSPRKDAGHDHIPRDLFVSARFAKELAWCPKSRQDWIDEMIAQGVIE